MRIGACILAAGLSRRYGRENKLLALVDGVAVARRVAGALQGAGLAEVVAVVGHEAELVVDCLRGAVDRCVFNADYAEGMGTSVAAAARVALEAGWDGLMVAPGDLPWLLGSDVERVRDSFATAGGLRVVVPRWQGQRGHPVCFPRGAFVALSELRGEVGGRLVSEAGEGPVFVEAGSEGCVWDRDVRE